jgi:hypothetical protein
LIPQNRLEENIDAETAEETESESNVASNLLTQLNSPHCSQAPNPEVNPEAKAIALEKLNACPVGVIHCFISRSWQFASVYRLGLTGKTAAWAVQKFRQHRSVSQQWCLLKLF